VSFPPGDLWDFYIGRIFPQAIVEIVCEFAGFKGKRMYKTQEERA
jgi:hypothetical protein